MSIASVLAGERPVWIECNDAVTGLRSMPDECVHMVMTSPPYYALRDYGTGSWEGGDPECDHKAPPTGGMIKGAGLAGPGNREGYSADGQYRSLCGKCGARRIDQQLGLEDRHDCGLNLVGQPGCGSCYICHLLAVFTEVKRVLRQDGVLCVNLADSYSSGGRKTHGSQNGKQGTNKGAFISHRPDAGVEGGLLGIPWRFALAMQSQDWLLRSSVLWAKLSPMPESISGWRWERHRVKVRVPQRGAERKVGASGHGGNHRSVASFKDERTDSGRTLSAEERAEWEPCPGCARCEPHGGYVLRKGSWRPTRSHEHVFIFAKSSSYWCDGDAVRTPIVGNGLEHRARYASAGASYNNKQNTAVGGNLSLNACTLNPLGANLRDVLWTDEGPLFRLRDNLTTEQRKQVAEFLEPYQSDEMVDTLTLGPEPCSIALILNPSPDCPLHAGQPGPLYVDRPPASWKKCTCERTSHFAAFPTTLCRPFLEAFCPQRCCAECGTGWVRVVEREVVRVRPPEGGHLAAAARRGESLKPGSMNHTGTGSLRDGFQESCTHTLGWRPACNCNSQAEPVPGLTLDCFSGTGTLALTARRMGLRAIGVELSPAYALLSRERIRRDSTLFNEVAVEPAVPAVPPSPEPDLFGQLED